jgi:RNA polymerase sigma-70 factor (ECF subfamily)
LHEFPETRDSLLVQVKDPGNQEAWEQFVQIYRPVILRIARAKGFQHADAQDLVQKVLVAVAGAIGRYERNGTHTKFRHWLSRIARNAILNALTRQPRDAASGGSSVIQLLEALPDRDPATEELISLEYRREIFLQAARMVRSAVNDETWQLFERTVIEEQSIEETAKDFNKSVGAVYTARSRVMYRLREAVQKLEAAEE